MKTAVFIGLVIVAAAVIAAIRWRYRGIEIRAFWDILRHPQALRDLNQVRGDIENAAAAISENESEIRRLVDFVVFEASSSRDAWTEMGVLAKLGRKPFPRALEILRDPSARDKLAHLTREGQGLPEAPICRLCEIFDNDEPAPAEVIHLLVPFLRHESSHVRKSAALVIGATGDVTSIPELRRALVDDDQYVRSSALIGIQRAITKGRLDASAKVIFYEVVASMWPRDTAFEVCDTIPDILLSLDREQAVRRLQEPDLLTSRFEPVWRILDAFLDKEVLVSRASLIRLIEEACVEPIKNPMNNILGGSLALLGRHSAEEDLPTLERMVEHPDRWVSQGAVRGMYVYHRFFDNIRQPRDVVEEQGWDALTQAEKHVCAIEELECEVINGGFAQYYFNPAGDHWKDALSGLAAIGAIRRHQAMAATVKKFNRSQPSPDRDVRSSQLAKIVRRREDPFDDQDTAWYELKDEHLDRLILRYNLANAQGRVKAAT